MLIFLGFSSQIIPSFMEALNSCASLYTVVRCSSYCVTQT